MSRFRVPLHLSRFTGAFKIASEAGLPVVLRGAAIDTAKRSNGFHVGVKSIFKSSKPSLLEAPILLLCCDCAMQTYLFSAPAIGNAAPCKLGRRTSADRHYTITEYINGFCL